LVIFVTDYRAELQRLVQAYDEHAGIGRHHDRALFQAVKAARAALAQPEPEGLRPDRYELGDAILRSWLKHGQDSWCSIADDVLAELPGLAQPGPEGVTDEELYQFWESHPELGLTCDEPVKLLRAGLTRFARPATKPVPVAERLPEPGRKVLAHYLNALGKPRTIIAEWVPAKTREDSPEGDLGEYDDETDLFYWPEGWYEQIENWEDFTALLVDEGEITHWQPLPRGPHHALPLPQP
jgi:hypothetical protein